MTNDSDEKIRQTAAQCIHEAFLNADKTDDTSQLREALHELLSDDSTEVLISLIANLDKIICNYGNQHAVTNFNPNEH